MIISLIYLKALSFLPHLVRCQGQKKVLTNHLLSSIIKGIGAGGHNLLPDVSIYLKTQKRISSNRNASQKVAG